MSGPTTEVHDARPVHLGSWTFEVREGDEDGPVVATVRVGGMKDVGEIRVGDVPFAFTRESFSRAYDLVFEGVTLARAAPAGPFSSTYDLSVEPGLLDEAPTSGGAVSFAVEAADLWRSVRLTDGRDAMGVVDREGLFARHFALRFRPDVPLVLRVFCLALQLARLRRQQRS